MQKYVSSALWLLMSFIIVSFLAGCSPSLSPLYRDYKLADQENPAAAEVPYDRIRAALEEAGWQPTEASAANAISTEDKVLSNWGLYKVIVSLEVLPFGDQYVRVFFHPYRKYFTGGRSKIPYMKGSLQSQLLSDLNEAFEDQGLKLIGTPRERDRTIANR